MVFGIVAILVQEGRNLFSIHTSKPTQKDLSLTKEENHSGVENLTKDINENTAVKKSQPDHIIKEQVQANLLCQENNSLFEQDNNCEKLKVKKAKIIKEIFNASLPILFEEENKELHRQNTLKFHNKSVSLPKQFLTDSISEQEVYQRRTLLNEKIPVQKDLTQELHHESQNEFDLNKTKNYNATQDHVISTMSQTLLPRELKLIIDDICNENNHLLEWEVFGNATDDMRIVLTWRRIENKKIQNRRASLGKWKLRQSSITIDEPDADEEESGFPNVKNGEKWSSKRKQGEDFEAIQRKEDEKRKQKEEEILRLNEEKEQREEAERKVREEKERRRREDEELENQRKKLEERKRKEKEEMERRQKEQEEREEYERQKQEAKKRQLLEEEEKRKRQKEEEEKRKKIEEEQKRKEIEEEQKRKEIEEEQKRNREEEERRKIEEEEEERRKKELLKRIEEEKRRIQEEEEEIRRIEEEAEKRKQEEAERKRREIEEEEQLQRKEEEEQKRREEEIAKRELEKKENDDPKSNSSKKKKNPFRKLKKDEKVSKKGKLQLSLSIDESESIGVVQGTDSSLSKEEQDLVARVLEKEEFLDAKGSAEEGDEGGPNSDSPNTQKIRSKESVKKMLELQRNKFKLSIDESAFDNIEIADMLPTSSYEVDSLSSSRSITDIPESAPLEIPPSTSDENGRTKKSSIDKREKEGRERTPKLDFQFRVKPLDSIILGKTGWERCTDCKYNGFCDDLNHKAEYMTILLHDGQSDTIKDEDCSCNVCRGGAVHNGCVFRELLRLKTDYKLFDKRNWCFCSTCIPFKYRRMCLRQELKLLRKEGNSLYYRLTYHEEDGNEGYQPSTYDDNYNSDEEIVRENGNQSIDALCLNDIEFDITKEDKIDFRNCIDCQFNGFCDNLRHKKLYSILLCIDDEDFEELEDDCGCLVCEFKGAAHSGCVQRELKRLKYDLLLFDKRNLCACHECVPFKYRTICLRQQLKNLRRKRGIDLYVKLT